MNQEKIIRWLLKNSRVIVLVLIFLILIITCPTTFLAVSNINSILLSISIYGILTVAMLCEVMVAGPDMSVGGIMAISGLIVVKTIIAYDYSSTGFAMGLLLGVLFGLGVGIVNGVIVYVLKAPSFLITLAMQFILFGFAQLILQGKIISCIDCEAFTTLGIGRLWGVPIPVYVLIATAIIIYILVHHTIFGRNVYAVGGNSRSSGLSGINVRFVTIASFAICGLGAGLAGVLLAALNQQASPVAGSGYESTVLLCSVIGGASFGMGIGSAPGAVYGALFVGLIQNGMRLLGIPSMYTTLIQGVLVIMAVAFEISMFSKNTGMVMKKKEKKAVS